MRRLAAALAILCWCILLLAAAAGIRPGDPWQPAQERVFPAADLHLITGVMEELQEGVRIDDLGGFGQGLQVWDADPAIDTDEFATLTYRTGDFSRNLELGLILRGQDDTDNVRTLTLPWPGQGPATVLLDGVPEWHGRITELGLTQYPLPALAPQDAELIPFTLHGVHLASSSISGRLRALANRWSAWTPWSMRSINLQSGSTFGPAIAAPNLFLPILVGGIFLLLLAFRVLPGRRLRTLGFLALAAWLLLDASWLSQLQRNHAAATELYGTADAAERAGLVADRPLLKRATELLEVLAQQPDDARVLYWTPGEAGMTAARLGYFLRPYNVAPLAGVSPGLVPDGTLLLIDNNDGTWRWDTRHSRLEAGALAFHGDLLWRRDALLLVGVRAEAGP